MTTLTIDLSYRNPETNALESDPILDEYIAEYLFNAGDLTTPDQNGFHWIIDGQSILTPSGESEAQLNFPFGGNVDPGIDSASEARFSITPMGDMYYMARIFVPSDYYHRHVMQLIIPTGSLATWQAGDIVFAQDGLSSGIVVYAGLNTVSGDADEGVNCVYLRNADNELGSGTWVGDITNTTRSETRTVTRRAVLADNNKFAAFWSDTQNIAGDNDGYSARGASPTVVFEMRPSAALDGGSTIYYHFGADREVVGNLPNSTSDEVDFIRPADFGTHIDLGIRIANASSEAAEDGVISMWVKRSGESVFTEFFNQTNCKIGPRADAIPPNAMFGFGYIYGYWNMCPPTSIGMGVNEFKLSASQFSGVL